MKLNFTKNFNECIYPMEICYKIKNSGFHSDPTVYNAIWGEDVPDNIELAGGCAPDVGYVFRIAPSGKFVPVRVTFSRSTLANFERGRKRFAHLDPECDI